MTEAQAWAEVRVKLPAGTPIAAPTWMPSTVDRDHVDLRLVDPTPNAPRYVLAYLAPKAEIVLALGPISEVPGSGYGTRVRGVPATLTFSISLWTDPTPAPRRVRWVEGGRVFSISSERFTGDDLLHIAWSLDPAGVPGPKFARSATGACAGVAPEETTRHLVELIGTSQADAIVDCFPDEYVGATPAVSAAAFAGAWTGLPRGTVDSVQQVGTIGGRSVVQANWTFASEPGLAWNLHQTMFFTLGVDLGRWRIHEMGTGAVASPP
jgi:hypothetical protein